MLVLGSGISLWILLAVLAGSVALMAYSYRRLLTMVDFGPHMPRIFTAALRSRLDGTQGAADLLRPQTPDERHCFCAFTQAWARAPGG